jgi:hypothetical protein
LVERVSRYNWLADLLAGTFRGLLSGSHPRVLVGRPCWQLCWLVLLAMTSFGQLSEGAGWYGLLADLLAVTSRGFPLGDLRGYQLAGLPTFFTPTVPTFGRIGEVARLATVAHARQSRGKGLIDDGLPFDHPLQRQVLSSSPCAVTSRQSSRLAIHGEKWG